jgi:predicted MFS family arabinose efflux permease
MCALLAGTGLARFAYTPLLPALVNAGWVGPADAAYLGAANLLGYLAGALVARWAARRMRLPPLLRAMMVATTLSLFLSAVPLGFLWLLPWRLLTGVTGAFLMVLAPPAALAHVPHERRGLAGGVILTGVGLGIALSGLLMPVMLRFGVSAAWCGLGALALVLTIAAWGGFTEPEETPAPSAALSSRGIYGLAIAYALNAVGLVPHMVFLADFVARGLGEGVAAGAHQWILFGLGALGGPVVFGRAADRIGFSVSVRIAFALEAACVGALALTSNALVLDLSSFVIGAYVPGITTLVLGRARELVPPDRRQQEAAWSTITVAWALGQAAGAYGLSALYAHVESYTLMFALGAAALVAALVVDVAAKD